MERHYYILVGFRIGKIKTPLIRKKLTVRKASKHIVKYNFDQLANQVSINFGIFAQSYFF